MSDLADLIEEDHHTRLLESGNLGPRRRSEWTGETTTFHSLGYIAKIDEQICRGCGTISSRLLGVFHKEANPRGDSRLTALDLRTLNIPTPIPTETQQSTVPACVSCLPLDL